MAERRINMRQVRWAGWTMAIVTALCISGVTARADIASDKPAAILIYPKIAVDVSSGVDTVVRMSNTNQTTPILMHCFYLDANAHCSGGTNDGDICNDNPQHCDGGLCLDGWQEVDFRIRLTGGQPLQWKASDGLLEGRFCAEKKGDKRVACKTNDDCDFGTDNYCMSGIPITSGSCQRNPGIKCGSDADCNPSPGGTCTQSNSGTRIPGVPEDPFRGELKCIAINEDGIPLPSNVLKGEALLEKSEDTNLDVASYNAIGIQATGKVSGDANVLTLGGDAATAEYNGCPNFLILNHFFEEAQDPVPGSTGDIETNVVYVPCSEDLLRQIPGAAVVQYLVFNEFEQRFSTSKSVTCFQDTRLCHIDTPDCSRSIFNVKTAGTLTGQTRINPIGKAPLPSALLGIAVETHNGHNTRSAAFNLHMQGARDAADTITIP
jgi:hypothetical protein